MADIRIKDLTTLESASLTGDVFVIDGTTGTRKLSAFSPTFGGNATVTGTLTVNGATLTSTGDISVAADKGIYLKQGNVHKWTSDGTSSGTSRADIYADSGGAFFIRTGGATQALTISSSQGATFAGAVAIPATTASTTTSTGALVVGNGTSGGLGVGGDVNIGGTVTVTSGVAPQFSIAPSGGRPIRFNASTGFMSLQANPGGWFLGIRFLGSAGTHRGNIWAGGTDDTLDTINIGDASYSPWLTATASGVSTSGTLTSTTSTNSGVLQLNLVNSSTGTSASSLFRFNAGTRTATLQAYNDTHATLAGQLRIGTSNGDIVLIPSGVAATTFGSSTVTVNHSTASTSTSSGALVVSGGVGVAKGVTIGETTTSYGILTTSGGDSDSVYGVSHYYGSKGATYATSFLHKVSTSHSATASANKWKLSLCDGTSAGFVDALEFVAANATFFGSVKTAAPSGGTAANWKLGTVATVSPTSPNRTIEVDIGGTIYYIHAKTTNN